MLVAGPPLEQESNESVVLSVLSAQFERREPSPIEPTRSVRDSADEESLLPMPAVAEAALENDTTLALDVTQSAGVILPNQSMFADDPNTSVFVKTIPVRAEAVDGVEPEASTEEAAFAHSHSAPQSSQPHGRPVATEPEIEQPALETELASRSSTIDDTLSHSVGSQDNALFYLNTLAYTESPHGITVDTTTGTFGNVSLHFGTVRVAAARAVPLTRCRSASSARPLSLSRARRSWAATRWCAALRCDDTHRPNHFQVEQFESFAGLSQLTHQNVLRFIAASLDLVRPRMI